MDAARWADPARDMKRNRSAAIGLLLVMTCQSRTAMAVGDNLVPNADFDADLTSWEAISYSGSWSSCSHVLCQRMADAAIAVSPGPPVLFRQHWIAFASCEQRPVR